MLSVYVTLNSQQNKTWKGSDWLHLAKMQWNAHYLHYKRKSIYTPVKERENILPHYGAVLQPSTRVVTFVIICRGFTAASYPTLLMFFKCAEMCNHTWLHHQINQAFLIFSCTLKNTRRCGYEASFTVNVRCSNLPILWHSCLYLPFTKVTTHVKGCNINHSVVGYSTSLL